jgi:hypothetical protein
MEHETGSGWTGSPAHVSDDANGGNGAGSGNAVGITGDAQGGNEANRESALSAGGSAGMADGPSLAAAGASDPAPAGAAEACHPATSATGEPRVDAALRLLERLPGLPVAEHPQLFEQVHAQLSEVLGELDPGPDASPAGR